MTQRKDSNDDTEAVGLDVASLVGRRIDEIRSRVASNDDLALIVGHEPIPTGWPAEIVKLDDKEDALVWSYRTADGVWKEILLYGSARRTPTDPIPALIFTRRPVDPAVASMRPIALLIFNAEGTCTQANASAAENRMILAAKEAHRAQQPQPTGQKGLYALPANRARSPIELLERLLELPIPSFFVNAEDFITESDGRLVLGVAASPQPLFVVHDAGSNPRLLAFVEPARPPKLTIITDAGEWPPLEIGPGGLRVLPKCGMESDEAALDFFKGETGHRVIDATGATHAVHIIMVAGPCLSSRFPNAGLAVRVVLLASPEAGPPTSEKLGPKDLVVRPDQHFAEVHAPDGSVVVAMKTTIQSEVGAYLVDGIVTRG